MKLSLLILSFVLFVFTTNIPLTFSEIEQVKDINGNSIFPGGLYHIVPAIFGPTGGGVRLGETGNSTCPVTVLQDYSEVINGLPVRFTIPAIGFFIIFTGTRLDIAFEEDKPECATSSKWVVIVDDFPKKWVGIGGIEDHPGKQVIIGRFGVEKYDVGYKLVFCYIITAPPSVCFDIGTYDDENGRRLILTANDEPFPVVFVNAGVLLEVPQFE